MLRITGVLSLLILVAGPQPAAFSNVTGPIPDCRVQDVNRPDAGPLPVPTSPQAIPCSNPTTNCAGNWGLDRLDAPDGLDSFYGWNLDGTGVHIYILDGGFAADHPEFADRVDCAIDFSGGSENPPCGGSVHDSVGYGHATHVAAIAAGKTYGVAKNARLTLVKLAEINYERSLANALRWVAADIQQNGWPAVVNLSGANRRELRHDSTLHAAIRTLLGSGALLVQAAGNQEQNACEWSFGHPYAVPGVLVMGGLDRTDSPYHDNEDPALVADAEPGTNFGRCVDLWAPASQIRSAAPRLFHAAGVPPEPSADTFCRLTGTSMAAPFATGVAALLLQRYPQASSEQLETAIRALAVGGRLNLSPHLGELPSPNLLLQSRVPQSTPTLLPPKAGDDFFQTNGTPVSVRFSDLTRNDWDWDGGSLAVTSVSAPASGTFTPDAGGFTYSPASDGRNVAFEYRVRNHFGVETTGRITILNSRPVAVDDQILFTGTSSRPIYLKQEPLSNDFDPDGVADFRTNTPQVTVVGDPEDPSKGDLVRLSDGDNPSYEYRAGAEFDGEDSFRYRVRDAEGNESWETIHLRQVIQTITSTVTVDDRFEMAQDQEVLLDVIGRRNAVGDSDSQHGSWTLVDVTPPAHGAASIVSNQVRYAPVAGYAGFDSFTYRVRNGSGADAEASVLIEIVPVPGGSRVPRAEDDFLTTPRNTELVIGYAGLLANDLGDDLRVDATIAAPQHGTVRLCCSGLSFTYIPDRDFFGERDWFNYRLIDGSGAVDIGTIWVDVTFANRPPVAGPDSVVTEHDTPVSLAVLANDSDPDGDALSLVGVTQPASGGTVTFSGSTVTFTPTPGFGGWAYFSYTVRDAFGASTDGSVSVRVRAANVPPAPADDFFAMFRNGTLTFTCAQLLANDVDPDAEPALGDQLTVTSVGPPTSGTLTCASCSCTFRPVAGSVAPVDIPYQVSDARPGGTATAFARVAIVNRSPVANPDVASTPPGTPVTIDVRANDSDPDGDPITVRDVTTQAASGTGTCSVAAGGMAVVYTPPAGFLGQASCAYRVADDLLATSSPATITIYINKSPIARGDQLRVPYGLQTQIGRATLLANDYDPDGNTLTIASFDTTGLAGTLSCPTGSSFCTFTPAPGFTGVTRFNYTATDSRNGFSTATVKLKVGVVQNLPIANDDLLTTFLNTSLPFTILNVLANDTDADGDVLNAGIISGPRDYGTMSCSTPTYHCTYTPNTGFIGVDRFSYTADDGADGSAMAYIKMLVQPPWTPSFDAREDQLSTPQNTARFFTQGLLKANDYSPTGDPLNITSYDTTGLNGTLDCSSDPNGCTYRPPSYFAGVTRFKYTVRDNHGNTDTAIVRFKVGINNAAPVAANDSLVTRANTPVRFSVFDLLKNDLDAENDPLTVTVYPYPSHGTVSCSLPSYWCTYTPAANYTGSDSFTYIVSDGIAYSNQATVTLTVQAALPKDAQILSQNVPASMFARQSYPVSLTFKNVGTQTWSPIGPQCNAFRLGSVNPYDNTTWGSSRVELSAAVPPGGEVTVNFTVTAPSTPGTYNFQWRMVHECVQWLGDLSPNVVVIVSP